MHFMLPNRTVTKKSCRLKKTEANDHRHFFNNSITVNNEKIYGLFFLSVIFVPFFFLTECTHWLNSIGHRITAISAVSSNER